MACKDSDFKDSISSLQNSPSIDEWITAPLRAKGQQTLDALGSLLPETNWAQLFLAVDRLSRAERIRIRQTSDHDYLLSLAAIMAESISSAEPKQRREHGMESGGSQFRCWVAPKPAAPLLSSQREAKRGPMLMPGGGVPITTGWCQVGK
jgi:hypothetical protein